jgi:uncharacterized protein YPO0396
MANTFKSFTKASIGTTQVDVYTVPAATTSIVIGFCLTNRHSATVTADVFINKSAAVDDVYLVKGIEIPIGTLYDFNAGNKIILQTGDKIQINSNTASSVDVIVSILEQT